MKLHELYGVWQVDTHRPTERWGTRNSNPTREVS